MKTKYFGMLIVACVMGTQVMNAQADKPKEKREHKRPTMEQISEMQCHRIVIFRKQRHVFRCGAAFRKTG